MLHNPDLLSCSRATTTEASSLTRNEVRVQEDAVSDLSCLFDLVLSGADALRFGDRLKPEPDCYLHAQKVLGLSNPIAFEDTQISGESPSRAGIPWVAAPSEWATEQDFSKAVLRVKELSELDELMKKSECDSKLDFLAELAASSCITPCKKAKPVDGLLFGSIGLLTHGSEVQWRAFNQALREKYPQQASEI